jgi:TetR/AcrR family transcriptional regulator
MSTHDDLRAIALSEFAIAGYGATSLQRIAELAGLSKSSVLYHFASKEALLEAAISPALDRMELIITPLDGALTEASQREFIVDFVDFLLDHRLEVHMFINQGQSLVDVPVVQRANQIVLRMATYFSSTIRTTEDRMRFGVALGGAAYTLVTSGTLVPDPSPVEETRAALVAIVSELLAPITIKPIAL